MHTTRRTTRTAVAGALVALVALGGGLTACSDEDGDGATTDEEVEELDQEVEEGQNEAED